MLLAARQTVHGLYAFVRFVILGARRPPTPRPVHLYDQDAPDPRFEHAELDLRCRAIAAHEGWDWSA